MLITITAYISQVTTVDTGMSVVTADRFLTLMSTVNRPGLITQLPTAINTARYVVIVQRDLSHIRFLLMYPNRLPVPRPEPACITAPRVAATPIHNPFQRVGTLVTESGSMTTTDLQARWERIIRTVKIAVLL